jgi:RNA polymerase-binding transcription factor DksA
MNTTDPRAALDALIVEYTARANSIREDLASSHSPDFAEQAGERENDEVLTAILAETEAALRRVGMAKLRLADASVAASPKSRRDWRCYLRPSTA